MIHVDKGAYCASYYYKGTRYYDDGTKEDFTEPSDIPITEYRIVDIGWEPFAREGE